MEFEISNKCKFKKKGVAVGEEGSPSEGHIYVVFKGTSSVIDCMADVGAVPLFVNELGLSRALSLTALFSRLHICFICSGYFSTLMKDFGCMVPCGPHFIPTNWE